MEAIKKPKLSINLTLDLIALGMFIIMLIGFILFIVVSLLFIKVDIPLLIAIGVACAFIYWRAQRYI